MGACEPEKTAVGKYHNVYLATKNSNWGKNIHGKLGYQKPTNDFSSVVHQSPVDYVKRDHP